MLSLRRLEVVEKLSSLIYPVVYVHVFTCLCVVNSVLVHACVGMNVRACLCRWAFHCVSVCVRFVCGHHGRGPHYLAGSHTDIATDQWGQLAYLILFLQHFNELVMGGADQLP